MIDKIYYYIHICLIFSFVDMLRSYHAALRKLLSYHNVTLNRHIFYLALINHIIKLDILEWHQNKKKNNSLKKKPVNKQSQEIFTEMKELILMSVDNR